MSKAEVADHVASLAHKVGVPLGAWVLREELLASDLAKLSARSLEALESVLTAVHRSRQDDA